jgi:hypothetical protein
MVAIVHNDEVYGRNWPGILLFSFFGIDYMVSLSCYLDLRSR